ncbi:DUF6918 family protein [Corynebacterium sp. p3-SID1056]|uniref:DUF6918 family protein n=1 Tax=Corynebacterium sp. p3-SID1056 TaxID=2916092 RepID=UPI0021A8B0F1|nr:hypothetical protein [Corynebacterium sp. p3-SID1056]MCT2338168.1 hypothetical protein [Corynebacterium sp. p3-SID1056]
MSDLKKLLDPTTRPAVANDLAELAETTTANQSGLTGMAMKSALAAGKKADADAIPKGMNKVLPKVVDGLGPHWAKFQAEQGSDFGSYLATHEKEVVDDLVKAADAAVDSLPGPVKKVYTSLRNKAAKIVGPALPELGQIVQKHTK